MKEKTSVIKNNLYFLKLIWKISPARIIIDFILELYSFAGWVFYSVIFVEFLFSEKTLTRSFLSTLIFIWIAAAVEVSRSLIFGWYYDSYLQRKDVKIHCKLNSMLFKKAESVDLACFETPEFYNTYTKAATEASSRAHSVISSCAVCACSLAASVFVTVKMARITPLALIFIALPLIGNLYFGKKQGRIGFKINEEATPDLRRINYVNRIVYFKKYAGELRLTNIYAVLEKMFKTSVDGEAEVNLKYAAKNAFYTGAKSVLMFLLGYEGMWLCAAVLAVNGKITLSELIVLLNAIVSVSWMMHDLEWSASEVQKNAFFINNLKSFLDFKPEIDETKGGKTPPSDVESLEFKNVSFGYKGQSGIALKNVSLKMHRGVRHALVGINGSGKTTLIKLMMRFYDPTEGEILLNGINIKEFDVKKYRSLIGAAFQDFALFAATVTENVLLYEPSTEEEKNRAVEALKNSDVYERISKLENKENAILTREFDDSGVELSGGERQKIAIARAFAGDRPIVVLDEPSSALDPVAEYKMFETVTRLCKGENKLSVIVSHRLSSAAMCEKLFVFEKGELKEEGSHKELLKNNGIYSDLFYKQARNYTAGEVRGFEE